MNNENFADVVNSMLNAKAATMKEAQEEAAKWHAELTERAHKLLGVCLTAIQQLVDTAMLDHRTTSLNVCPPRYMEGLKTGMLRCGLMLRPHFYTGPNTTVELTVDFESNRVLLSESHTEIAAGTAEEVLPTLLFKLAEAVSWQRERR